MGSTRITVLFCFLYFSSGCINRSVDNQSEDTQTDLSLYTECFAIQNRSEKICYVETQSQYGPYDDVVFYLLSSEGGSRFIKSDTGNVATFGGLTFSDGGTFLFETWAEEGHPILTFHRTEDFISGIYENTKYNVGFLSEYHFDHVERFTDDGTVVYARWDDDTSYCTNYESNKEGADKKCLVYLNIVDASIRITKLKMPYICHWYD